MANKYWVGGGGYWSPTDTTSWSDTDGGAGDATVPTASDDVFFTPLSGFSGGGLVIIADGDVSCKNLTFTTGHTFSFTDDVSAPALSIYGSITLESDVSFSFLTGFFLVATSTGKTIDFAGATVNSDFFIQSSTGGWTLLSDLILAGSDNGLYIVAGTFNSSTFNVTALDTIDISCNSTVLSLNMGSGTWSTGNWSVYLNAGTYTFNAGTSTLKIITTGTGTHTFRPYHNEAYYNIWFSAPGSGIINIYAQVGTVDITVHDFIFDSPPRTIQIVGGSTITVTSFICSGASGNLMTLTGSGGTVTFSKSSGIVNCDFLNLVNCAGAGGATWYAGVDSVDGGGNTGWIFTPPPSFPSSPLPTFRH